MTLATQKFPYYFMIPEREGYSEAAGNRRFPEKVPRRVREIKKIFIVLVYDKDGQIIFTRFYYHRPIRTQ
jgi:hypothetical protein